MGKSYFIEQIVRQDILNGHGVCVIDPHGELYDHLLSWIIENNIDRHRTVHLLNPSDKEWSFGWNPLAVDNEMSLHARVNAMVDAFATVWGGEDLGQTPRLKKCLTSILYVLAHHNLSLTEARFLTSLNHHDIARALTQSLGNNEFESVWRDFLYEYKESQFLEYFESTISRLLPFVSDPTIQTIVGQTENLIDFRTCMDKRHIVLVNLKRGNQLTAESSRLLGALLTSDLYNTAFSRDPAYAKVTPFYLTVDECSRYLNESIASSLDETRKYGLHLILSHQRIKQLSAQGETFYDAIMAGAQVKVLFNLNDEESAEIFSRLLFRKEFDLEIPKHILDKPVVVDHEIIWLEGESHSSAHIRGSAIADTTSTGQNIGIAEFINASGNEPGGATHTLSDSDASSSAYSSFDSSNESYTQSRNQALKPVLKVLPTATYQLDELIHLGMVELLSLPPRQAFVYSPLQKPQRFSTIPIKQLNFTVKSIKRAVASINENSDCLIEREQASERIRVRHLHLGDQKHLSNSVIDDDGLG